MEDRKKENELIGGFFIGLTLGIIVLALVGIFG